MTSRSSRAVGRVLVGCVAGTEWDATTSDLDHLVRGADLGMLPSAAAFHGVAGCVHRRLRDHPILPVTVADDLTATYHRARLTHLQALADLARLASVLDALGTPWLTVKGPVLAERAYPRPDLRGYTDLDIVVPRRAVGRALVELEAIGARVLDLNWDLLARTRSAEVHVALGNTVVDLHWHLFNIGELRGEFPISMAELYERAPRVELPTCRVPTLDRADTALHLGVHGCLSGANRLVWLKDIEQATAGEDFPWDELVARTRMARAGLPVASMLRTAHDVIGTPVPDEIIRELAGSEAWPRLVAGAARACHPERTAGRRSPLRLVARSTRRDFGASAAALARRSWAGAHDPRSAWPDVGPSDPDDPNAASHAAGDRSDFLASVTGDSAW